MRYVFHPEAEVEFDAAIDYYEDREPGLGYDFAVEVHSTLENILSFPKVCPTTGYIYSKLESICLFHVT